MANEAKKTEVRELMCQLTDDEQRMRVVELAQAIKLLDDLDIEKRTVADRIKTAEANRDRLATVVKYKQESREVECLMEPDYKADTMTYRHTDTMEIVFVRQLTYGEKQQELPMDGMDGEGVNPNGGAAEPPPCAACGHGKAEHEGGIDKCFVFGCNCNGYSPALVNPSPAPAATDGATKKRRKAKG